MSAEAGSIFISYRRSDSEDVLGRINDHLVRCFGEHAIFRDVDSLAAGRDFPEQLRDGLERCHICLVMIGRNWLSAKGESGARRLDDETDFVRFEIETALRRNIPVIPVLIGDVRMPAADDLPVSIRALAAKHAAKARPDPDFRPDMDRLTRSIQQHVPLASSGSVRPEPVVQKSSSMLWAGAAALVLVVGGAIYMMNRPAESPVEGDSKAAVEAVVPPTVGPAPSKQTVVTNAKGTGPGVTALPVAVPDATKTTPVEVSAPAPKADDREAAFLEAEKKNCAPLERVSDRDSRDGHVFFELGRCQAATARAADARKSFTRALDLDEAPSRVHTELARVALGAGDTADAGRHVDDALKAQAGFAPALLVRGDIFMKQRNYKEAARTFDVVFQKTKSKESCEKLADSYEKNGVGELAEETRSGCAKLP
jgi:hypothetical protein